MQYVRTFRDAPCPVCGHTHAELLYEISSCEAAQWFFLRESDPKKYETIKHSIERLWQGSKGSFVKCRNCGFCFADPFVAGDAEFYAALYETPRYPSWKWEFEMSYNSLRLKLQNGELNQPRLLEIGAGDGAFVRRVAESLIPPEHIVTLEYSQYGKKRIEEAGITCLEADVRELPPEQYRKYFDVVCMFQVLEHLDNLDTLFTHLSAITTENAVLYIAVPNDRRVEFNELNQALGDMAPCHVGRWNERSFRMISDRFGWSVIDHQREPEAKIRRFLEFSLYRYVQQTKKSGSIFNRAESVQNRLLRYIFQVPLIGAMALASVSRIPQLLRNDLGKSQWVELRKVAQSYLPTTA